MPDKTAIVLPRQNEADPISVTKKSGHQNAQNP